MTPYEDSFAFEHRDLTKTMLLVGIVGAAMTITCRTSLAKPLQARQAKVNATLSNSLGFGGHNACIILGKI